VTLAARVFDGEAAQFRTVVVEEFRGADGARDQNGVGRQPRRIAAAASGENAQQPVRKVVEVALPLPPIGVGRRPHAPPQAVLDAFDGGFGRKPAAHRHLKTAFPAPIVGEHAIGFEDVAMFAVGGEGLMAHNVVERRAQLTEPQLKAAHFRRRLVRHKFRDDDPRLVQKRMPKRDPFRHRLALDARRVRVRYVERRARTGDGAGQEMLGDDHGRRL
jgi:hypothetical protein